MRKLSDEVVRFNCRLPKPVADWIGERANKNGVTLSEEVRHMLIDARAGEYFLKETLNGSTKAANKTTR